LVVGLATAMISGMPGLFSGTGFLTAQWGPEFSLPAVGKVKMGTPLVFDIGVYLVVAGVVLTLYEAMERGRLREKVEPEPAPTP
jgi:multicomponent Na+:H+ antiporter subunit B